MAQHFEGDTKKFTLTAFLSFATVFCILILFMQCHGNYEPKNAHSGSKHESVGEAPSQHNSDAHPATAHEAKDTAAHHKMATDTLHK